MGRSVLTLDNLAVVAVKGQGPHKGTEWANTNVISTPETPKWHQTVVCLMLFGTVLLMFVLLDQ